MQTGSELMVMWNIRAYSYRQLMEDNLMFYQYYLYFQNKVTKQGLSKGCTFISKEVTTQGSNLWGMFSREKSIYAFRKAKKESYIFISQGFPSL